MAISKRFLAAVALFLAASYAAASYAAASAATVNDELAKFGLPPGLLPDSVLSYSLADDGRFEVELRSPCYVKFTDLVFYDKKIKGRLSYGLISDLEGIQLKKLFVWVQITSISASSPEALEFQAGFLSEKLPVSLFETVPHCKAKPSCRGSAGLVPQEALPISEV
ncbi:Uncharacterized protein AXF42_Ash010924 [Apostasia shenzhenica]|uniref:DUF538 domain-containing protein n=1 Tax=Apostasia shenzhenica TaxID=1088818 RepID=A0A2H9ZQL0_9ASPA|nr:Uncharacterized protein AXF42_Ash010924 [Apostasia shenzhenica]